MTGGQDNPTVLNTTVLSNFAQVDHLELLRELPRVVTVVAVQEESREGVETHPYLERALAPLQEDIPVVSLSQRTKSVETELLETLDPGEAQALALAETADGVIVTDDGDARTTAKQRGVSVTGSIGLLVRFVEDGDISAETADLYLKRWIDEAGFRSPSRDFDVFFEA